MAASLKQLLAVSALLSAAEKAAGAQQLSQSHRTALERAIEDVRATFWGEVDGGMSRARHPNNTVSPARGFK
jgi:hypothetical protein